MFIAPLLPPRAADADYQSESSVLVFSPAQHSISIPVTVIEDDIVEVAQTFFGFLGNSLREPVILAPDAVTVTILDANDSKGLCVPSHVSLSLQLSL